MMGGLAYMTGPPGDPLRAGTSVIDVTGGMFGAIGDPRALEQRHHRPRQKVSSRAVRDHGLPRRPAHGCRWR
jgi:crotonobetainyl-CoA:carnitine CoA-transferase CaiB-like acyl-CoA transferase